MKKQFVCAGAMSLLLCAAITGCSGGSDSGKTTNSNANVNAGGQDGSSLSDQQLEQAVDDLESQLDAQDGADQEPQGEETEVVYEPCQEILDADFKSGLIQLNNDVFQMGGYVTVAEFVEQYSDRYEITYMDGTYEERKDYLLQYDAKLFSSSSISEGDVFGDDTIKTALLLTPKYGNSNYQIYAYIENMTSPDEKITIDQGYVVYVARAGSNSSSDSIPMLTSAGIAARIGIRSQMWNDEWVNMNDNYNISTFAALLEEQGFESTDNAYGSIYDYVDKYYRNQSSIYFAFVGEPTPSGVLPFYECTAGFDTNTDKIKYVEVKLRSFCTVDELAEYQAE